MIERLPEKVFTASDGLDFFNSYLGAPMTKAALVAIYMKFGDPIEWIKENTDITERMVWFSDTDLACERIFKLWLSQVGMLYES